MKVHQVPINIFVVVPTQFEAARVEDKFIAQGINQFANFAVNMNTHLLAAGVDMLNILNLHH